MQACVMEEEGKGDGVTVSGMEGREQGPSLESQETCTSREPAQQILQDVTRFSSRMREGVHVRKEGEASPPEAAEGERKEFSVTVSVDRRECVLHMKCSTPDGRQILDWRLSGSEFRCEREGHLMIGQLSGIRVGSLKYLGNSVGGRWTPALAGDGNPAFPEPSAGCRARGGDGDDSSGCTRPATPAQRVTPGVPARVAAGARCEGQRWTEDEEQVERCRQCLLKEILSLDPSRDQVECGQMQVAALLDVLKWCILRKEEEVFTELQLNVEELTGNCALMKARIDALEAEVNQKNRKISSLENEVNELHNERPEKSDVNEREMQRKEQEQLLSALDERVKQLSGLEVVGEELRQLCGQQQAGCDVVAAAQVIVDKCKMADTVSEEAAHMREEVAALRQQRHALALQVKRLQMELQDRDEESKEMERSAKHLQQQREELRVKWKEREGRVGALQEEVHALGEELCVLKAAAKESKAKSQEFAMLSAQLRHVLASFPDVDGTGDGEVTSAVKVVVDRLRDLSRERSGWREEKEKLQKRLQCLQLDLREKCLENKHLEEAVQDLQSDNKCLTRDVEDKTQQLERAQRVARALQCEQEHVGELRRDLLATTHKLEKLEMVNMEVQQLVMSALQLKNTSSWETIQGIRLLVHKVKANDKLNEESVVRYQQVAELSEKNREMERKIECLRERALEERRRNDEMVKLTDNLQREIVALQSNFQEKVTSVRTGEEELRTLKSEQSKRKRPQEDADHKAQNLKWLTEEIQQLVSPDQGYLTNNMDLATVVHSLLQQVRMHEEENQAGERSLLDIGKHAGLPFERHMRGQTMDGLKRENLSAVVADEDSLSLQVEERSRHLLSHVLGCGDSVKEDLDVCKEQLSHVNLKSDALRHDVQCLRRDLQDRNTRDKKLLNVMHKMQNKIVLQNRKLWKKVSHLKTMKEDLRLVRCEQRDRQMLQTTSAEIRHALTSSLEWNVPDTLDVITGIRLLLRRVSDEKLLLKKEISKLIKKNAVMESDMECLRTELTDKSKKSDILSKAMRMLRGVKENLSVNLQLSTERLEEIQRDIRESKEEQERKHKLEMEMAMKTKELERQNEVKAKTRRLLTSALHWQESEELDVVTGIQLVVERMKAVSQESARLRSQNEDLQYECSMMRERVRLVMADIEEHQRRNDSLRHLEAAGDRRLHRLDKDANKRPCGNAASNNNHSRNKRNKKVADCHEEDPDVVGASAFGNLSEDQLHAGDVERPLQLADACDTVHALFKRLGDLLEESSALALRHMPPFLSLVGTLSQASESAQGWCEATDDVVGVRDEVEALHQARRLVEGKLHVTAGVLRRLQEELARASMRARTSQAMVQSRLRDMREQVKSLSMQLQHRDTESEGAFNLVRELSRNCKDYERKCRNLTEDVVELQCQLLSVSKDRCFPALASTATNTEETGECAACKVQESEMAALKKMNDSCRMEIDVLVQEIERERRVYDRNAGELHTYLQVITAKDDELRLLKDKLRTLEREKQSLSRDRLRRLCSKERKAMTAMCQRMGSSYSRLRECQ